MTGRRSISHTSNDIPERTHGENNRKLMLIAICRIHCPIDGAPVYVVVVASDPDDVPPNERCRTAMETSRTILNRAIFWRGEPCGTVLAYIGQSSYGRYVQSEKEYFVVQTKLAHGVAKELNAFKVAQYESTERMGDGSTSIESPLTKHKRKRGENQPHMSSLTWLSNGLRPLKSLRKRRNFCRLTFLHVSQSNRP